VVGGDIALFAYGFCFR